MQVTFKSPDNRSEQKVDISLDSTVAETRSAIQMLLGLPESSPFNFFLERTNTVLSDGTTFREVDIQESDEVTLVPLDFKVESATDSSKIGSKDRIKGVNNSKNIAWKTVLLSSVGIAALVVVGGAYAMHAQRQTILNSERLRQEEQQRIETEQRLAEAQKELEAEKQLAEAQKELEAERQLAEAQKELEKEQEQREALQKQLKERTTQAPTSSGTRSGSNSPSSSPRANATIVSTEPGSKNIRSGPGTGYEVKHIAYPGDRVLIRSSDQDSGGYKWYKIYFPKSGAEGWIAAQLLQPD